MKILVLWLALSAVTIKVCAQATPGPIRPLTIGDTVPDIAFTSLINYHSKTARLSDFKGKLVILDFWATWCGSCIKKLPLLDSLQNVFKNDIQVILINSKATTDSREKIESFLKKRNIRLLTVIEDTVLKETFPHMLIPHYIWINSSGVVQGITSSDDVTADNISSAVTNSKKITLGYKKDINTNYPLFLSDDAPTDNLNHYSIFLKGKINGLPSANRYRKKDSITYGRAMTNTTLLSMFIIAGSQVVPDFTINRMILDVEDSTGLILNEARIGKTEWYKNNSYTYELIVPVNQSKSLYTYMLEDLNRYSPYSVKVEKRKVNCLILNQTNSFFEKLNSSDANSGQKASVLDIMNKLNRLNSKVPILNETFYRGKIPINLTELPGDLKTIKAILKRHGLNLVEEEREIDMLVIGDKR